MSSGTTRTITVKGGYSPARVNARAGEPLRLVFDRQESSGCSAQLLIPAFGVRQALPAFESTSVEITPDAPGEYEFSCGMNMLRGSIVVEA